MLLFLWACDYLCASALIVFGADVSMVDQHGDTPLHTAEQMGLRDIAELLQTSINYGTQQLKIRRGTVQWPPRMFCRQSSYQDSFDCPSDVAVKRKGFVHILADTFEKFKEKVEQATLDKILACAMETFDFAIEQEPVGR